MSEDVQSKTKESCLPVRAPGEAFAPPMTMRVLCLNEESMMQLSGSSTDTSPHKQLLAPGSPGATSVDGSPRIAAHTRGNNYHRSEGQNVGNFLTERSSSRVMAPPGGHSNISFG